MIYDLNELSPNARKVFQTIVLAFPIVQEIQKEKGNTDDEIMSFVVELMNVGAVSIEVDENGGAKFNVNNNILDSLLGA